MASRSEVCQSMAPHNLSLDLMPNQCGSSLVQTIEARKHVVWSFVRRFDNPQAYKPFVRGCTMLAGDGSGVGSVRDVDLISGLPAKTSMERLDELDDEMHVMVVSFIGGDHKLMNYRSVISLHQLGGENGGDVERTVVTESYVVDIPAGSNKEDTCFFAETIIGFNLQSLATVSEKMASSTRKKATKIA